jgi:hypothetical protein
MKRSHFLAGLLGLPMAAQQEKPWIDNHGRVHFIDTDGKEQVFGPSGTGKLPPVQSASPRSDKPKNGQCPVCGTMAEAYRPLPAYDIVCSGPDGYVPCPLPKERDVRCKRCNVKFAQDTEPR